MTAQEAFNSLDPEKWAITPLHVRLHLLEEVRHNLQTHMSDLAQADADMKNNLMGEDLYGLGMSKFATAGPIAAAITGSINLYESLAKGAMPKPNKITRVREGLYDIEVFPHDAKEKIMNATQSGHLRVKGEPAQVSPLDKPAGIIAVSGAGNYSSSLEMVKAMFWENKAVIHKPHHLNEETDAIWEKVFAPMVEYGALAFCDSDQGRQMSALEGLHAIYFTGSTGVAKAIQSASSAPLVSECGGNNPCIIVPGDRAWTDKEIEHQVLQIITAAKLNGGAVCGRPQTIVTSKHWPQREQFLDAIRNAIAEGTPAAGTYYPGSDKVMDAFKEAHPDAELLEPEGGQFRSGSFMFIAGVQEDSYAVKNEAFCQIMDEVPLDVPAKAEDFLPAALEFCNNELLGSLGCMVLIDEETRKAHTVTFDNFITDLSYGGIAVNTIPPLVFANAYLTWGGNEEGKEFVSGEGNFGNMMCFENIEKSILYDKFMSMGHLLCTNKVAFDHLTTHFAEFAVNPSWRNMTRMMGGAIIDSFRGKDF